MQMDALLTDETNILTESLTALNQGRNIQTWQDAWDASAQKIAALVAQYKNPTSEHIRNLAQTLPGKYLTP